MLQKLSSLKGLIILLGLTALPPQAWAEQQCAFLKAWAEQNVNSLPRTYEGLAQYPVAYRRAIFSRVDPEVKSLLWRTHIERYLDAHPSLTSEQQDVLRSTIDLLNTAFFNVNPDDPRWNEFVKEPIADVIRRARPLFSTLQMHQIFEQLGGAEKKPKRMAAPYQQEPPSIQCSCSTSSDYCSGDFDCWSSNCTSTSGCGTFWAYTCDGVCFRL